MVILCSKFALNVFLLKFSLTELLDFVDELHNLENEFFKDDPGLKDYGFSALFKDLLGNQRWITQIE